MKKLKKVNGETTKNSTEELVNNLNEKLSKNFDYLTVNNAPKIVELINKQCANAKATFTAFPPTNTNEDFLKSKHPHEYSGSIVIQLSENNERDIAIIKGIMERFNCIFFIDDNHNFIYYMIKYRNPANVTLSEIKDILDNENISNDEKFHKIVYAISNIGNPDDADLKYRIISPLLGSLSLKFLLSDSPLLVATLKKLIR